MTLRLESKRFATATLKADGTVSARFSDAAPDSVGDVVLPTAFTDGQAVPIAAWGHGWERLPIGKGTVHVEAHGARLDGVFFDHPEAQATRTVIKQLGALQEWSFGFQVRDSYPSTVDGAPVRVITDLELLEVSPVLIGAQRQTSTVSIRGGAPGLSAAQHRELRAIQANLLRHEIAALERAVADRESLMALAAPYRRGA